METKDINFDAIKAPEVEFNVLERVGKGLVIYNSSTNFHF